MRTPEPQLNEVGPQVSHQQNQNQDHHYAGGGDGFNAQNLTVTDRQNRIRRELQVKHQIEQELQRALADTKVKRNLGNVFGASPLNQTGSSHSVPSPFQIQSKLNADRTPVHTTVAGREAVVMARHELDAYSGHMTLRSAFRDAAENKLAAKWSIPESAGKMDTVNSILWHCTPVTTLDDASIRRLRQELNATFDMLNCYDAAQKGRLVFISSDTITEEQIQTFISYMTIPVSYAKGYHTWHEMQDHVSSRWEDDNIFLTVDLNMFSSRDIKMTNAVLKSFKDKRKDITLLHNETSEDPHLRTPSAMSYLMYQMNIGRDHREALAKIEQIRTDLNGQAAPNETVLEWRRSHRMWNLTYTNIMKRSTKGSAVNIDHGDMAVTQQRLLRCFSQKSWMPLLLRSIPPSQTCELMAPNEAELWDLLEAWETKATEDNSIMRAIHTDHRVSTVRYGLGEQASPLDVHLIPRDDSTARNRERRGGGKVDAKGKGDGKKGKAKGRGKDRPEDGPRAEKSTYK